MKYKLYQFEAAFREILPFCRENGIEFEWVTPGLSLALAILTEEQYVLVMLKNADTLMEPLGFPTDYYKKKSEQ